jgi:hypothetical protein
VLISIHLCDPEVLLVFLLAYCIVTGIFGVTEMGISTCLPPDMCLCEP